LSESLKVGVYTQ